MGKYGTGQRNDRWDRPVEFARSRDLYIVNDKYQKKENALWTWKNPDECTRNQMDFIMTNRQDIIIDVAVINRVNTGSDHKFVRSKVKFSVQQV